MAQLATTTQTLVAGVAVPEPSDDDRLPIPHAALIICSLSLGLWVCIGLLLHWMIG
jgi:hypothetical protein